MEDILEAIAEDPIETLRVTLIFAIGIIILAKVGADRLAKEFVELHALILTVGGIGTILLVAKLYQKALESKKKPMV